MKPELILRADILDIIFEGRNKEYGAYNLRKEYNGRMNKAMTGVLILVAGIFIMNSNRSNDRETSSGPIIIVDSISIAPPPVSDPPPAQPPKVASANGIDICNQKARNFRPDDFEKFDKIYAMAEDVVDDMRRIAKNKFDPKKVDLLMNELYPVQNLSCLAVNSVSSLNTEFENEFENLKI